MQQPERAEELKRSGKNNQDLKFVRQILNQNDKAWNRFVDRYSDQIWQYSWKLCKESCFNKSTQFHCVFWDISSGQNQSKHDDRFGCDDGLEIYTFIFNYLYNRKQKTGKLKFYNGRAKLDTFINAVLYGHLRDDWIRHKRGVRVDQIYRPPEIKVLSENDQLIFDQMVLQRNAETISRKLNLSIEFVRNAETRITHQLMANDNLFLILHDPERQLEEEWLLQNSDTGEASSIHDAINKLFDSVMSVICDLSENEQILLHMAFEREMKAEAILQHCKILELKLPVNPSTGKLTIHTIYQSVDFILGKIGKILKNQYASCLNDCLSKLDELPEDECQTVSVKGLKELLKQMGIQLQKNGPQMEKHHARQ